MGLRRRNLVRIAKYLSLLVATLVFPIQSAIAGTTFGSAVPTNLTGLSSFSFTGMQASLDGSKVLVSVGQGYLLKSNDSGATWTQIISAGVRNWTAIAINESGTVMAAGASNGYIYLSTDSGSTWNPQTAGIGTGAWVAMDMNATGSVVAATNSSNYVYITRNSGDLWSAVSSGALTLKEILVSATGEKMVAYAQGSGTIIKTSDTGTNWAAFAPPVAVSTYPGLWMSRDGSKVAFARTGSNVPYNLTNDFGTNWETFTAPGSTQSAFWASDDLTYMWSGANGGGSVYSTNKGVSWTAVPSVSGSWKAVYINQSGDKWHAAVSNSGFYSSNGPPSSPTFQPMRFGTAAWSRSSISNDGQLIAVSSAGSEVAISQDGGQNWTPANGLGRGGWNCLAISGDGSIIYAGQTAGRLYKSSDRGASWNPLSGGSLPATNIYMSGCATNSDGTKVAVINTGTGGGVLYSSNSGGSFALSLSNTFNSATYAYTAITMTGDGSKMAVISGAPNPVSLLVKQSVSDTWTLTSVTSARQLRQVKGSADGSVLTAVFNDASAPVISKNWGSTWETMSVESNYFQGALAVNDDGSLIVLGNSTTAGKLFYSTDKGSKFTQVPGSAAGYYSLLALSGNSTKLIYGVDNSLLNTMSIQFSNSANFSNIGLSGVAGYRSQVTISATLESPGTDGRVTFYANGKPISGCIKIQSSSLVANCSWKPSTRGAVTLSAKSFPSDTSFNSGRISLPVTVTNRTSRR